MLYIEQDGVFVINGKKQPETIRAKEVFCEGEKNGVCALYKCVCVCVFVCVCVCECVCVCVTLGL